ncbi:tyrosine-type recombinase/integrase [Brevibacillus sp. VP]|uniref:tyrosine-type recombinase/integrase n=1 Tax=unclassified Brevibacillus TaxID=2684853 RepID=UPI002E276E1C
MNNKPLKEVRRAIKRYIEERSDSNDALFLSNRQQRISVRSVQHLLEKYGFHAHQLRHTFITALVRDNQDIGVIQSLSGHKSTDMVLRYSKPTEEERQKAVDNLFLK